MRRSKIRIGTPSPRPCKTRGYRFVTLALDQLVNQAAKAHFMSGGQLTVPLVLRTQGGAGYRGGAQHSQSLEAWLAHEEVHIPSARLQMMMSPLCGIASGVFTMRSK
jgi:pyruvate/2-oxoglutarate/acetoin dehydrogenase E1 component